MTFRAILIEILIFTLITVVMNQQATRISSRGRVPNQQLNDFIDDTPPEILAATADTSASYWLKYCNFSRVSEQFLDINRDMRSFLRSYMLLRLYYESSMTKLNENGAKRLCGAKVPPKSGTAWRSRNRNVQKKMRWSFEHEITKSTTL